MTQININPDVMRQLTDRTVMTKPEFLQLGDEGRMRAFTIAAQTEASVMQDTLEAIRATVAKGGSLWEFKQDFPEILAPYREAGREWHLDLIFTQNVAQARAVGAHAARQASKRALPYVEYIAGAYRGDVKPRPAHTALHGKVFSVDDPFLLAHTPPWDFGCNCWLVSRTRQQVGAIQRAESDKPPQDRRVTVGNQPLQSMMARNQLPHPESGAIHPVDMRPPALKGGEYSFRPDRLNQPVDLSRFDPEIRARLIEQLKTVGYQVTADGLTAMPPDATPSASRSQTTEFRIQNSRVSRASASKAGLPRRAGEPWGDRTVGRPLGRVGGPAPQIARVGPAGFLTTLKRELQTREAA